ncbi:MAG TPA: immunoglobulin-like domain-containing protein [Candidatus Paceibacterota bacterium]
MVLASTTFFTQASTTMFTNTGDTWLTSPTASSLLALDNLGKVIATTSIGTNLLTGILGVGTGGTGASTFGQGWIYSTGGTTALAASTSPTVNYVVATSTTLASIFPFASSTALTISGNTYLTSGSLNHALLSTDANGKIVATTSVGVNYLTGTLGVANGGTGAATLTGLLQGNGTNAVTGIAGTAGQFPYYNGASTLLATSTLFLSTESNVGIGTTSPMALLSTYETQVNKAANYSSSYHGFLSNTGSAQDFIHSAIEAFAQHTGGAALTTMIGVKSHVQDDWGGITNARVFNASIKENLNFQTITNAVGFYAQDFTKVANSTMTNSYGVYVEPQTGATNNYGAYFGSNVGIGTTTPNYALTVGNATKPQLELSDLSGGNSWTLRNIGSTFYLATSTATATSTVAALTINPNGAATFGSPATTTFTGGVQSTYLNITGTAATSTFARGINLAGGCYAISSTCLSLGNIAGTLAVNQGGTGATTLTGLLQGNGTGAITGITGTAGQFPYYNGVSTLLATSTIFLATNGMIGVGTTTPFWALTVGASASTTGPQLALVDTNGTNAWTFRVASSTFYLATSSALATSTTAALAFNGISGAATFGATGTTTFTGGLTGTYLALSGAAATSTAANGFNLAAGCFAISGTCLSSSATLSGGTTGMLTAWASASTLTATSGPTFAYFTATSTTGTSTIATGQGFTIGSSQFVVQQGSGNVGIGTAAPSSLFQVFINSADTSGVLPSLVYTRGTTGTAENGIGAQMLFQAQNSAGTIKNTASINGQLSYVVDGSEQGTLYFQTGNAGALSEAMRIDYLKRVGIGTTTPNRALVVSSATDVTAAQFVTNTTITNSTVRSQELYAKSTGANADGLTPLLRFYVSDPSVDGFGLGGIGFARNGGNTTGDFVVRTDSAGSDAEKFRITSGGNVGIGTTSPIATFAVQSAGVSYNSNAIHAVIASTDTNGPQLLFTGNTSYDGRDWSILSTGSGNTAIGAGKFAIADRTAGTNATRLVIDSSGNVGIGTTTPKWTLTIASSTGPQLALVDTTASSNAWTLRNIGNTLYVATSSYSATSTTAAIAIDPNGAITFGAAATTTFSGGINITKGCFAINNACIGYITKLSAIYATSTAGTTTVQFTGAGNSNPSFSAGTLTLQGNVAYYVVEGWGGGGGGGAQATNNGATGAASCYAQGTVACASALIKAGGGGGGTLGDGVGAGGAGGTASLGSVNLNGQAGETGGTPGVAVRGGGDSPRGGAGAGLPTVPGTAGVTGGSPGGGGSGPRAANGNSAGSGGGGAYSQNVASTSVLTASKLAVGAGGAGGAAGTLAGGAGAVGGIVITIYATSSPSAAGNDYAEMFPVSNPLMGAGDIVAVDRGIPVSMKLAIASDGAPLAGVISTLPGQVLGDQNATGERPIALSGRVPVKVNLENGPIAIGDRIAVSSVPGVGKKAGPFDDSVGIAIDNYAGSTDSTGSPQADGGTVMIFMNLQKGTDINAIAFVLLGPNAFVGLSGTSATSATSTNQAGPLDFVGGMMNAIASRLGSLADTLSYNATTTDATSTSATSTADLYAQGFIQSLFSRITEWLASAANGIEDLFAKNITAVNVSADTITAKKLCLDDVCVTKSQLQAMLSAASSSSADSASTTPTSVTSSASDSASSPPVLSVNGNNPATINVGDSYVDLGASVSDDIDQNLGIHASVDGGASITLDQITIDTSVAGTHTIEYSATDAAGNVGTTTRTVEVVDPNPAPAPDSTSLPQTDPTLDPTPTDTSTTTDSTSSTTPATSGSTEPETTTTPEDSTSTSTTADPLNDNAPLSTLEE